MDGYNLVADHNMEAVVALSHKLICICILMFLGKVLLSYVSYVLTAKCKSAKYH